MPIASYKPVDCSARLLPAVLSEQLPPGSFEFALDHLVDHELDLSPLDAPAAENVQFIALSSDAAPSYTHLAKFVRELGEAIRPLFLQVLLTCDRLGLIGKSMFAIDGVKLPGNASALRQWSRRSGTSGTTSG